MNKITKDAEDLAVFVKSKSRRGILLPMIRKVIPTLIAREIVGVQPMTGPVGQIFSIRPKYGTQDPES
jgi:hypothetical protein